MKGDRERQKGRQRVTERMRRRNGIQGEENETRGGMKGTRERERNRHTESRRMVVRRVGIEGWRLYFLQMMVKVEKGLRERGR
jgi:hypothetical protein